MIIDGTPQDDDLIGTEADDTISGLNGDDLISGGLGNDSLEGGNGDDTINGGEGNDFINGGSGDNVLNGIAGDDVITFGAGEHTVNGGSGNDSLSLDFSAQTDDFIFTYNVFEGLSPVSEGILAGTTIVSIEQVELISGSGNDLVDIAAVSLDSVITGGEGDDSLIGGLENDSLEGEEGNDTFFGGFGDDDIVGGAGNDAAVFQGLGSDYEVILGETSILVTGGPLEIEIPVEEGEEGETITVPVEEFFTDTLSEVEIILFENGEVVVETGEFIPFDPDSPDSEAVPLITSSYLGVDEDDIPVYRFSRTDIETQFYTTSEIERDIILDTLPQYKLDGISFVGVAPPDEGEDPLTGTIPVYRFFNTSTGVHLYTADENERAFVEDNLDNYVAEGTPYYGYETQVEGTIPLYRFYNQSLDAHFYTLSIEERDFFIESPDYEPEGSDDAIAFYVEPIPEL